VSTDRGKPLKQGTPLKKPGDQVGIGWECKRGTRGLVGKGENGGPVFFLGGGKKVRFLKGKKGHKCLRGGVKGGWGGEEC